MKFDTESTDITVRGGQAFSVSFTTLGFLLSVVFIVLKCCGILEFSWFWVFFPMWIVPAVSLAVLLVVMLAWLIYCLCKKQFNSFMKKKNIS